MHVIYNKLFLGVVDSRGAGVALRRLELHPGDAQEGRMRDRAGRREGTTGDDDGPSRKCVDHPAQRRGKLIDRHC